MMKSKNTCFGIGVDGCTSHVNKELIGCEILSFPSSQEKSLGAIQRWQFLGIRPSLLLSLGCDPLPRNCRGTICAQLSLLFVVVIIIEVWVGLYSSYRYPCPAPLADTVAGLFSLRDGLHSPWLTYGSYAIKFIGGFFMLFPFFMAAVQWCVEFAVLTKRKGQGTGS